MSASTYADNNPVQTLVERKKRQWAKEREELASLSDHAPWISGESLQEKHHVRPRYVSKYQSDHLRRDTAPETPPRRQSLPPLNKNQGVACPANEKSDKEMGGETSGYGSDNPNQTPEHFPQAKGWTGGNLGGYESSSSGREDRLKWGDRGVHVGKFWEPKEVDNMAKNTDNTPGWVRRGLERDTQLVVVSNSSPAESPEQDFGERPCTSSSSQTKCYIRGQNVPVDASELAEREKRRQIALSHQEAVREQLEERERRRQEERARRIREEYEEEVRIAREQELERKRQEQERRIREEKLEREQKRKEALREAIRIAEKEAREEKAKQKLLRANVNVNENVVQVDKVVKLSPRGDEVQLNNAEEYDINKNRKNEVHLNNINNNVSDNLDSLNNNPLTVTFNQQENLAFVLQNPLESLQNAQFAVLIPTVNSATTNSLPIAVPIYSDGGSTARTENRILTPTQYRNRKVCDSSTQTDPIEFKNDERYVRERLSNLEISYERRKERRSRGELREHVEDRPKWGVNRPPTRYLKQSEKDPLYQRRKLRQKMRQVKIYDDKGNYSPHSSDDSQTASPRTYRKKGYAEKRQRALWRNNERLFAENVRVYHSEIVPLESDKDHIYFKGKPHHCCCKCSRDKEHVKVVDILKIEHSSPRECFQAQDRDKLPSCLPDNSNVLDKLNAINALKQEHWNDPSKHYSPSRNP